MVEMKKENLNQLEPKYSKKNIDEDKILNFFFLLLHFLFNQTDYQSNKTQMKNLKIKGYSTKTEALGVRARILIIIKITIIAVKIYLKLNCNPENELLQKIFCLNERSFSLFICREYWVCASLSLILRAVILLVLRKES